MLADVPYEELVSHRFTFHGAPRVGEWAALPFSGPVLQAEPRDVGGLLLRTSSGLWLGADTNSLHSCHTSFSEGLLLAGGAGRAWGFSPGACARQLRAPALAVRSVAVDGR